MLVILRPLSQFPLSHWKKGKRLGFLLSPLVWDLEEWGGIFPSSPFPLIIYVILCMKWFWLKQVQKCATWFPWKHVIHCNFHIFLTKPKHITLEKPDQNHNKKSSFDKIRVNKTKSLSNTLNMSFDAQASLLQPLVMMGKFQRLTFQVYLKKKHTMNFRFWWGWFVFCRPLGSAKWGWKSCKDMAFSMRFLWYFLYPAELER